MHPHAFRGSKERGREYGVGFFQFTWGLDATACMAVCGLMPETFYRFMHARRAYLLVVKLRDIS